MTVGKFTWTPEAKARIGVAVIGLAIGIGTTQLNFARQDNSAVIEKIEAVGEKITQHVQDANIHRTPYERELEREQLQQMRAEFDRTTTELLNQIQALRNDIISARRKK